MKDRKFAKVTVAAINDEQLKKGELRLKEVLSKHVTTVERLSTSIVPKPTGLHQSRKARLQKLKRQELRVNQVWWTMLGTFDPLPLIHMRPFGPLDDLKQTIALNFVADTKDGKPVLTITTGFFGGSKGVGTIYCAATKQYDVQDFETPITSVQGNTETTYFSYIQDRIITCCTNRPILVMGEIARIINNRLLLDYATFASINTDLQEFYGSQKVPLSTLVRFFYPISAPLTQNNGLIDGANHEKEARYILRFYVKYYELLKTYGGVSTGIEARNGHTVGPNGVGSHQTHPQSQIHGPYMQVQP